MRTRTSFLALLAVAGVVAASVGAASAGPPTSNYDPSVLGFMCRANGGVYSPPSSECGGCFYCLFPDGTLINCGGNGQCDVNAARGKLDSWQLLGMIVNTQLSAQLLLTGPPDLVALPTPASTPPLGFCRRNDQGQLLVNVYNQGASEAAASTLRVAFDNADPVDVATPAIPAGTGTELVVSIPNQCFAPTTCGFALGVDAANVVAEYDETNNNAAGLCGPQFQ